jgi:hypothetical protein
MLKIHFKINKVYAPKSQNTTLVGLNFEKGRHYFYILKYAYPRERYVYFCRIKMGRFGPGLRLVWH